jgi:hypothetical protein
MLEAVVVAVALKVEHQAQAAQAVEGMREQTQRLQVLVALSILAVEVVVVDTQMLLMGMAAEELVVLEL